ncbi:MAG: peptide chain release factor 1 [Thermoanaerobaculia bacterium]|nr:peptide chain release factor 1 [Thermoanaerobaculia bacterium]
MFDKLAELEKNHEEITARLADPGIFSDPSRYRDATKKLSELDSVVRLYRELKEVDQELADNRTLVAELSRGDELHEMAEEEFQVLTERREGLIQELRVGLTPKDPNDNRNVVLEIRAGTGGDEATLFAAELFRMYTRYAEGQRWGVEIIDLSESEVGGIKEVSAIIEGRGAFSKLKYEGGVHRVQRVPATEASGRIHTSAVTVAILPEADDVEVHVDEKDLRIDRFCSSGPGGQGVNTTYSAVRLTHIPTGLVVSCQDERSQIKNKAKALRVLKSRLLEIEQDRAHNAQAEERRKMVGSGDRSEKIRTYNFPQNRVTDHRIGVTVHQLESVLAGQIEALVEPLSAHFQAQLMAQEVGEH